jgi:dolichol-phosphate mannosyltransferase
MAQPSLPFELEGPRSGQVRVRAAALGSGALIVVPTYNELTNLRALITAVLRAAPAAHVLVVDDASPDGTGALADALANEDERVHVLHRAGKLGLGTAYVEGFRWGLAREYQSFLEMDADFSHDPGELPRLLGGLQKGADLVLGSRGVRGGAIVGWGVGRRLLSAGGSAYSRLVLGVRVRDLTTGYKAFSRRALQQLDLGSICSNGYAFQIELTYRVLQAGLAVTEVPITFVDRRAGQSKMDSSIFLEAVGVVWRLRAEALRRRA